MSYLEELFGMDGKLVIVTGGNKGIGRGLAAGFARAGADIAILSRSEANEAIAEIEKLGRRAYHVSVDVSAEDEVRAAIDEVRRRSGRIDVVINNAGVTSHTSIFDTDSAEFKRILDTNLLGEYYVARAAAMAMIDMKIEGSIINISSISASIVNKPNYQVAYNASKAAVNHMTRSMALELIPYGIRVNSISPGYMATPMSVDVPEELKQAWYKMIPMGRMGTPEELMPAALYLASSAARYTTGSDILVDGGYVLI